MLLLCHAIIPCVHTGIVIYPLGSMNLELRTIHVVHLPCRISMCFLNRFVQT